MSPHRMDIILIGMVAGSWWSHLSPVKKAIAALTVVLMVGFVIGTSVNQLMMERSGVLVQLERVQRVAVRDSIRIDTLERQAVETAQLTDRVEKMEDVLWRVDDRTQRIVCLLSGNRGPACL